MSLKIYPYNLGSESAKELSTLLGAMRVRPDGDFVPRHFMKVLNWGASRVPDWAGRAQARGVRILNSPSAVNVAANKLSALQRLTEAGIRVPEFTTSKAKAQQWLSAGETVMERHELRGNSGDGIRVVNLDDEEMESVLSTAPLYTKFVNKTAEFRVHVFNGQVIDYVQKMKVAAERRGDNFNKYISSVNYGWVFARNNIREMDEIKQLAIKAVRALGLDFGAVDIVYADGLGYVLEVNSAPGLAGTTLVRYGNAIRRYMGQPDLSEASVQAVMAKTNEGAVARQPVAAPVAQAVAPVAAAPRGVTHATVGTGDVTFRLDRATAVKLKQLLVAAGI